MITKRYLTAFLVFLFSLGGFAQQQVPLKKMQEVYEKIKTPYKYGLVMHRQPISIRLTVQVYSEKVINGT
jgi:hypothetical protein